MRYARNAYDAHLVLCNRVPLLGEGGVLTVGYPAYAVVPPGFAMVPRLGMAEASAALTVSFRPTTPMTHYTSWASPKHLMCMCFPHAPHAQHALPLRQCVHKRRLAKRFGACTVGTAAVGVVLLKSAPLKNRCLRMSHPNSHMVVFSSTNPNGMAVAKAFPAAYREGTHSVAPGHLPPQLAHFQHHLAGPIYGSGELPVACYGLWVPPPHTNNW